MGQFSVENLAPNGSVLDETQHTSIVEMSRAPPKARKAMSKRMERNMTKSPARFVAGEPGPTSCVCL
jgi:hypothetical protein